MPLLGSLALGGALGFALFTVLIGFSAGYTRSSRLSDLSRQGVYAMSAMIWVAAATLLFSLVSHDFSMPYVYGRSSVRMPTLYIFASFWGGQEGSLLFWVTVTTSLGAAATWVNRHQQPTVMPYVHGVLALTLLGFLSILNFATSPFETFLLVGSPADGTGLNPLLQTPLMAIHPPCLLAGFAGCAIPFAFGMGSLLAGETGNRWLSLTRRWTLIAWLFLSVGNILGGMWAYQELGWGGYWAWDAVENAALIPWFTASAFLHSVIIQEQRGMLKRWNAVLLCLSYLLTLMGTWMTRSGLIESVHSFADSEVGDYFLAVLLMMTAFSVAVVAYRWKDLRSERYIDSTVSREGAFLLNNWILGGMAFVTLWGTLFPKFKEMLTGDQVAVGPTWFNKYMAPLGLVLLALIALGTLLPWRRTTMASFRRHFTLPLAVTALVTPTMAGAYYFLRAKPLGIDAFSYEVGLALLCMSLIVFNMATILVEFVSGTKARLKHEGNVLDAFMSLFSKQRRRYGGYLVHVGIIFIFMAFLGNAVKVDVDATLRPGDRVTLGDYEVVFESLTEEERRDRRETYAIMRVERGGERVGELRPARFDFNDYAMLAGRRPDPMKVTSEIYIRSTPLEDVYVALLNYDPQQGAAAFKLVVLPFTWWLWFGGLVLILGTFVCLWPDRDVVESARFRARALKSAGYLGLLASSVLPLALVMTPMEAWAADGAPPNPGEIEHRSTSQAPSARATSLRALTADEDARADDVFALIMTTCEGCAGKTLATASPSCYPANQDKARIREMIVAGMDDEAILAVFIEERGNATLSVPPAGGFNQLVWLIPLGVFGLSLGGLSVLAGKRGGGRDAVDSSHDDELSGDDAEYLARLDAELGGLE